MGPDTHGKGNLGNFVGGTGEVAVEYAITAATRPFANFIWTLIPLAYFQQMEFVFNPWAYIIYTGRPDESPRIRSVDLGDVRANFPAEFAIFRDFKHHIAKCL